MFRQLLRKLAVGSLLTLCLASPSWGSASPQNNGEPVEKSRKDRNPMPAGWAAEDQDKAVALAHKKYPYVADVLMEDLVLRQQRLRSLNLGAKDIKYSYILLDSPYVNTYEDKYRPVRFMHSKHAASLNGDCAACHHLRPRDAAAGETVACRACHQDDSAQKDDARVGLKAAYHLQCMGCHKKMEKGPISCEGCHAKNPVDHKELVKLPDNPTPFQVTAECLRCHQEAGSDMIQTAHWMWRGPSPYTVEHQKNVLSGKGTTTVNNF